MRETTPIADPVPIDLVPNYWLRSLAGSALVENRVLARALSEAGLAQGLLAEAGTLVPLAKEIAVLEAVAHHADDPAIAISLGRTVEARTGSILSYILFSSATVREALANMCEFSGLTRPRSTVTMETVADGVAVRLDHPAIQAQVALAHKEFVVAGLVHALQDATGTDIPVRRVCFSVPLGARHAVIARAFGCPVEANAERTMVVLPAHVLDLEIRTCDRSLLQHLTEYGRMLLHRHRPDAASIREQVFRILVCRLTGGVPRFGLVADALALSERTLSRRLAEEGTGYREVVDEARAALAQALLDDRGLSLAQISYLLGFADQSSFTHAFRRWSGQSPAQARQRL